MSERARDSLKILPPKKGYLRQRQTGQQMGPFVEPRGSQYKPLVLESADEF